MTYIVCASPTCRSAISISEHQTPQQMHDLAVSRGWAIEQHADDDQPRAYCQRCKETTP